MCSTYVPDGSGAGEREDCAQCLCHRGHDVSIRCSWATLEVQEDRGALFGGQFNGSSGYEEAAVQGFMAGVNAAMKVMNRKQVVLDRSQAYIVPIDDLVTKENHEPYRMMTSRAGIPAALRQDNADIRLRGIGHEIGLVSDEEYERTLLKMKQIREEIGRLRKVNIGAPGGSEVFEDNGSTLLKSESP